MQLITRLTPNFTLQEFVHSDTAMIKGIENDLPDELLENAKFTCLGGERIRACLLGLAMELISGYRCADLNKAVNGSERSQHMEALALDFICPRFGQPGDVARRLSANIRVLGIDQLILEKTWVHASFSWSPRYETLTIRNGVTVKGIA